VKPASPTSILLLHAVITVSLIGCYDTGDSETLTVGGRSCRDWLQDDLVHAAEILADLQGGTVAVSGNTLELSFSGELGSYANVEDQDTPIPTAALYSHAIPEGDFTVTFAVDAIASTTTDLAAFVTVQNADSGQRFLFTETDSGEIASTDITWDHYGRYRFDDEISAGLDPDRLPLLYAVSREGSSILHEVRRADSPEPTGSGTYDHVYGEAVIGFAIQNRAIDGSAVTGEITASFSDFTIATDSGDCETSSF
jgi:hypothetical protein